ncbi:MAG: hypothetical protein NZ770_08950, partial [Candidatus Poseidoniaceae archaeon]|nr:hypothetical protein [Candidatus Poseidoniaceae archaeon]
GVLEQLLAKRNSNVDSLIKSLACFIFAKKLFANEEHSNTKPVSHYILVMPLARADLLAILNGIATQRHSRTVAIALKAFILSQALLDLFHNLRFRKELVGAALDVPFRELDSPLKGFFFCQFTFC